MVLKVLQIAYGESEPSKASSIQQPEVLLAFGPSQSSGSLEHLEIYFFQVLCFLELSEECPFPAPLKHRENN